MGGVNSPDLAVGLAAAVARLGELADVYERLDIGDGWVETPRTRAQEIAADLRVVLPATTPGDGDRGRKLAEAFVPVLADLADVATDERGAFEVALRDGHGGYVSRSVRDLARNLAHIATALAAAPAETEVDGPRSRLCAGCGRWHDRPGFRLLGWRRAHDHAWTPLPPGHMPPSYPFADDWEPVRERCNLAASPPAQGPAETEDVGELIRAGWRARVRGEFGYPLHAIPGDEHLCGCPSCRTPGEGQGATEGGERVTTAEVGAWDRERFGNRGVIRIALKLAEETGEVAGAVVKRDEGAVRPAKGLVTHEQWTAHLHEELGDVAIALHALCAREGTTLDEVVTRRFRDDVSLRTGQETPTPGEQCATCASRRPEQHPAVQEGGEVQLCPDPFHATITAENTAERVAALSGDLWTIYPGREGWWTPAPAGPQAEGAGVGGGA